MSPERAERIKSAWEERRTHDWGRDQVKVFLHVTVPPIDAMLGLPEIDISIAGYAERFVFVLHQDMWVDGRGGWFVVNMVRCDGLLVDVWQGDTLPLPFGPLVGEYQAATAQHLAFP